MMTITLGHHRNPDIRGGYYDRPQDPRGPTTIPVGSLAQAAKAARDFIDRNGLGGGNFSQAEVRDARGHLVATVSFNGRLWSPEGAPMNCDGEITGPVPSWAQGGAR